MLKIVKGIGPVYGYGEPVKISNKVYMPVEESDEENAGEPRISEEELEEQRRAEEQRRKEEEEKERERRIQEEIDVRFAQLVYRRQEAMEKERADIIAQAKKQAAAMAADAKAATMSVIDKAEKECVMLKEQARQEGYNEGFAGGKEESLEKYRKFIDAAGKLLAEINSRKEAYYISNEEEMRDTVFELVRKITGTEIKTDPRIIDGIIGEAAKNFRNSDYIKITLAEDGIAERFLTDEKLMREIIPFIPEIEIEFDDEAEEGTVILDNGSEIVDAGIPTQLDFLKEILKNTRGETDGDDAEESESYGGSHRKKTVMITSSPAAVSEEKIGQEAPKPKKSVKKIDGETAPAAKTAKKPAKKTAETDNAEVGADTEQLSLK